MFFFFQAEDGIRDAQESRGLGDVYKRQVVVSSRRQEAVDEAVASLRQEGLLASGIAADVTLSLIHI